MSRMCHADPQKLANPLSHKGSDASRSVSRILSPPAGWGTAIHLGCRLPGTSCGLTRDLGRAAPGAAARPSLFDLAPGGVYLAGRSPDRRWALAPPFHRCRDRFPTKQASRGPLSKGRGCVLSVALSFGSPRLGVTQRPALWSPDFPQAASRPRPSDRLAAQCTPAVRREGCPGPPRPDARSGADPRVCRPGPRPPARHPRARRPASDGTSSPLPGVEHARPVRWGRGVLFRLTGVHLF